MKEETIIRISVRSLVEFILREGDIDNRVSGSMEKDAMLLGGKIHRKIQSRMGTNYTAEVPLKIQMPCDGFVLQIEGRADGVLKDDGKVLIDEIKGDFAKSGTSGSARSPFIWSGKMLCLYLCSSEFFEVH